jgi:hypothetical protein
MVGPAGNAADKRRLPLLCRLFYSSDDGICQVVAYFRVNPSHYYLSNGNRQVGIHPAESYIASEKEIRQSIIAPNFSSKRISWGYIGSYHSTC